MKHLDTPVDSVETEHAQQVSDLKSNVINLQSDSNLLKKRVDAQDALNINVSKNSLKPLVLNTSRLQEELQIMMSFPL